MRLSSPLRLFPNVRVHRPEQEKHPPKIEHGDQKQKYSIRSVIPLRISKTSPSIYFLRCIFSCSLTLFLFPIITDPNHSAVLLRMICCVFLYNKRSSFVLPIPCRAVLKSVFDLDHDERNESATLKYWDNLLLSLSFVFVKLPCKKSFILRLVLVYASPLCFKKRQGRLRNRRACGYYISAMLFPRLSSALRGISSAGTASITEMRQDAKESARSGGHSQTKES